MGLFQIVTAISIFVIIYALIISEKIHRMTVALVGAVLLLVLKILPQDKAIESIDFNTIGLLIGMMITVNIIRRTGVFEYVAIKAAKMVKGDPWKILVAFAAITAIASAFLDNVTTILLIVPVALVITETLELNPIPFILPMVFASNIGGTATLIGDPPNIMIGSAANLGFMDFLINLAPIIIIIFVAVIFIMRFYYKKSMKISEEKRLKVMAMDEKLAIQDKTLLKKSLLVLVLIIAGFVLHQYLGFESATVALAGAALLLLISRVDPEEVLTELEWPTIFFFIGLFILVAGLEAVGVIDFLANGLLTLTGQNMLLMTILILWGSAILSAFLDNIPFVATMIPLLKSIGAMSAISISPLWWALSLGACLGGNGTLVGASANVIAGGLLSKHGHKLSFMDFTKVGLPVMIASILLSTAYLLIFYV